MLSSFHTKPILLIVEEGEPNPHDIQYHEMMWYPGWGIVQRRKREYMEAHPSIRARSEACPTAPSDDSGEDKDEDGRTLDYTDTQD